MTSLAAQPGTSIRSTLAGLWQIPLAIVGVGAMAGGMLHIATANRPLSFDEQLQLAQRLRDAGRYEDASGYLAELVNKPEQSDPHRAVLHMALAQTIHQAEHRLRGHLKQNVDSIITNFERAVRLGRTPDRSEWTFSADAYDWANREQEAVASLRRAIDLDPARAGELRRRIVEIGSRQAGELTPEGLAELDAILTDEKISSDDYAWALERKAETLLTAGDTKACGELIAAARLRLSGETHEDVLEFLEARLAMDEGDAAGAEPRLLAIRDRRETRDGLWGEAGRLLGVIELGRDRSEAALAYFEDVLQSYDRGELRDACEFGRAECLQRQGRHAEALSIFGELYDRLGDSKRHRYLSHAMIRTTLAVAGTTLCDAVVSSDAEREAGVSYLRKALDWFEPAGLESGAPSASRQVQLPLWGRVAESLRRLAAAADSPAAKKLDPMRAARLYEEAAEAFVKMSRIETTDESASAQSMWNAIEAYGAAGRRDRVIVLLDQFAKDRVGNPLRSRALHELGAAYQAEGRFPEAAIAYEQVIAEFLPLPAALASLVPLAQCLIQQGDPHARRGLTILTDIVDDRGPAPLFTPQAREYREALFQLARYYLHVKDDAVPGRLERAIERLEMARSLYPDDDQMSELVFHLADSYRRSAMALNRRQPADGAAKDAPPDKNAEVPEPIRKDAARRLRAALASYEAVIADLAPRDDSSLRDVERTYLKLSFLYRGDCLFDLGQYPEAREAYEEVAWRYADSPACVSASMQIYHCHLRMGLTDEARATLGRLKWLISTVPEKSFASEPGQPGKQYWTDTILRMERLDAAAMQ